MANEIVIELLKALSEPTFVTIYESLRILVIRNKNP